jgi:hypothetical protein
MLVEWEHSLTKTGNASYITGKTLLYRPLFLTQEKIGLWYICRLSIIGFESIDGLS